MRVLITGGAGFIGSHLAEVLLDQGHHVSVLDNLSTGRMENIAHLENRRRFDVTIGSVTDDRLVSDLVEDADVTYHLAAALGVRLVVERPVHTIETNVHGTETVLRHAARDRKPVLVASTSEVYGKSTALPFREDADLVIGQPTKHRWGYATSKLIDEFLALGYWKERQLPVRVVRFFNTVGPRQNSRYGMVIPSFIKRALSGEPIVVHGDGSQTRSFTWVGDVVSAMLALMDEPRAAGEVFNIGNGAEISILELAEKVKTMTGSESDITLAPYHEVFDNSFEDMPRRVPDIRKIQRLVGYKPTVHLDEILQRTIEYLGHATRDSRSLARGNRDGSSSDEPGSLSLSHDDLARRIDVHGLHLRQALGGQLRLAQSDARGEAAVRQRRGLRRVRGLQAGAAVERPERQPRDERRREQDEAAKASPYFAPVRRGRSRELEDRRAEVVVREVEPLTQEVANEQPRAERQQPVAYPHPRRHAHPDDRRLDAWTVDLHRTPRSGLTHVPGEACIRRRIARGTPTTAVSAWSTQKKSGYHACQKITRRIPCSYR